MVVANAAPVSLQGDDEEDDDYDDDDDDDDDDEKEEEEEEEEKKEYTGFLITHTRSFLWPEPHLFFKRKIL